MPNQKSIFEVLLGSRSQKSRDGEKGKGLISSVSSMDRVILLSLLAANVIPIVLAIIFGWSIGDVVIFYWWENIVIGLFTIPRIAMARGTTLRMTRGSNFGLIPFFMFHYFFFCFIHFVFLRVLFQDGGFLNGGQSTSMFPDSAADFFATIPTFGWLGLAVMICSYGNDFYKNYIVAGEYKKATSIIEMFRPYGRIVVMHICIIFGGFAVLALGSPLALIVLLMIGKTIMDVAARSMAGKKTGSELLDLMKEEQTVS